MPEPKTSPDAILAQVRVLRLTDRLLDVAQELREARDRLQGHLDRAPALPTSNQSRGQHNG